MKETGYVLAGVLVGLVAARFLIASGSCCARVASGVRDKVGDKFGSGAQSIGDALGVWEYTPGLVDLAGSLGFDV